MLRHIIISMLLSFLSIFTIYAQDIRDSIVEAVITDNRAVISRASISKISYKEIRGVISPLGEPDAISFVKSLPGVSSGVEGSNAFYVRGGNMGNNLITIDDVPIYGTGHLLGFTSVLSPSVIDQTLFYKGGFTSEASNLLSSHIKIKTKDGDMNKFHIGGSVSNFLLSLNSSFPIIKDKLSLIISARISPVQWEYNALSSFFKENEYLPSSLGAGVYDIYGKLSYKINKNNMLSLSVFHSHDRYRFNYINESKDNFGWDNLVFTAVWDYVINDKWSLGTNLSFNMFDANQTQEREKISDTEITKIAISSSIKEYRIVTLAHYSINREMLLKFGLEARMTTFNPGTYKAFQDTAYHKAIGERYNTIFAGANAQWEWKHKGFALKLGGRVNYFQNGDYYDISPEGRLSLDYKMSCNVGFEATCDYLVQYYHTLEGIPLGLSTDMIIPSGRFAPKEMSIQGYLGTYTIVAEQYKFSLGGYYKNMYNTIFFKDANKMFSVDYAAWKESLEIGNGSSYGMEFYAEKEGDVLSAKISYTLSKTDRVYKNINNGNAFPFKFDRRHILNAGVVYDFLKKGKKSHSAIVSFIFNSGHYETLQAGTFPSYLLPGFEGYIFKYYSSPNNYKMPDYIRLDIGYKFSFKGNRVSHDLTLGIYNTLNRHNAYSLTWDADASRWKKISILPIMPNINYTVEF